MSRLVPSHVWRMPLATAVLVGALQAVAAPVTHFSTASVGSLAVTQSTSGAGMYVTDPTGGLVSFSGGGTSVQTNFNPGVGAYYSQQVTSAEFSSASLASASLKGSSYLRLDNSTGALPVPDGSGERYASWSQSLLADQFALRSGNAAYGWTPATTFTFTFDVSGIAALATGLVQPASPSKGSFSQAFVNMTVYKTGTLALLNQREHIDWALPDAWDTFVELSQQIDANHIDDTHWYLGSEQNLPAGWDITAHQVDLSSGSARLTHTFAPGGDFEWMVGLHTNLNLEKGLDGAESRYDFSHTVTLGFVAPAGATVASASGLFPDTVAIGVSPVPEPGSLPLLLAGVAVFIARFRWQALQPDRDQSSRVVAT